MITYSLGDSARLGNQMFCIATVYGYAKKYNEDPQFYPYKYFNLPQLKARPRNVHYESHVHYTEIPYFPDLELRGYFQSYKYFSNVREDLYDVFGFSKNMINLTSVHVRRGDYLQHQDKFVNCTPGYYREAMNLLGGNNENFLFFSDDIQWCQENFKGNNIAFSLHNEIEDLRIMATCKNNIISASSYGWWAAYMNANKGRAVIAPSKWWGDRWGDNRSDKDICPFLWHKLNPYL